MNNIAILYGTSGGSVETVAKQLQDLFEGSADLFNVLDVSLSEIKDYKYLIVGTSTTGIGDLQDDWEGFLPSFAKIDFTGKPEQKIYYRHSGYVGNLKQENLTDLLQFIEHKNDMAQHLLNVQAYRQQYGVT